MGLQVLEFSADNPEYNLIFTPHVVLVEHCKRHRGYLPPRFHSLPNILIDTGSRASADMDYIPGRPPAEPDSAEQNAQTASRASIRDLPTQRAFRGML
jgi:hypothetical protein